MLKEIAGICSSIFLYFSDKGLKTNMDSDIWEKE
mgnify:CR=1 FL=1